MATANNTDYNLAPWKPGQRGNPSGRPKGTRDLAGYVLETTNGGKELVDACVHSQGRYAQPSGSERLKAEEGPAGTTSRPAEGHRDATRPWLR